MMQRYLTKAKTLFSQSQTLSKRMFYKSATKFPRDEAWEKMSVHDRINSALNDSDPKTAEVAFYKALGFTELGAGHAEEAIYFFKKAASMEPKTYEVPAKYYLANIYADMGQTNEAYQLMCDIFNMVSPQLPNSKYMALITHHKVINNLHDNTETKDPTNISYTMR